MSYQLDEMPALRFETSCNNPVSSEWWINVLPAAIHVFAIISCLTLSILSSIAVKGKTGKFHKWQWLVVAVLLVITFLFKSSKR